MFVQNPSKREIRRTINKLSTNYFKYKKGYWRDQIANHGRDSFEVARSFATIATRTFNQAVKDVVKNDRNYLNIAGCLVAIDEQAVSMARASDGIQEYYRLSDFWCRSILIHHTVDDARRDGAEDKAIENLKGIFEMLNWDFNEAYYASYDDIRTTQKVIFNYIPEDMIKPDMTDEEIEEFQIVGELDLVLEPTHEFPVGAEYQSTGARDGKIRYWKVVDYSRNSILCEPRDEPHKNGTWSPIPFSEIQLRDMKRVL